MHATLERSTFMTADEVAELTGIRRGKRGRTYAELQVEWLVRQGYPARLNAAGRAIVARSAIEGAIASTARRAEPEWTPNAWRK